MDGISAWYEKNSDRIRLVFTIVSGIGLLASLVMDWTGNSGALGAFDPSWMAILLCGVPIVVGAVMAVVKERDITADVLVSLALIGSLFLKEFFAAGEVAFIMQIGSMLEDFTSERAKKGISKLVKLSPKKANLYIDGESKVVDADEVKIGDIIQVRAGESVPVDGIIVEGSTSLDQSAMTGESVPVEKGVGDTVMSGTLNQSGMVLVEATKTAGDSSLQRLISLSRSADAQKAKIVRKANRWAAWLVVVSLATAVAAGIAIALSTGDGHLGFQRAVTVLVVFCPCAFVLATPTAISAGIGNASKRGVLVQSGEALERLAESNVAVFDKTGTLTTGKPSVVKVEAEAESGIDGREVLKIAASGEAASNHPLAKAIVERNNSDGNGIYDISNHTTKAGWGIEFEINGKRCSVGKVDKESAGFTLVGVYRESALLGTVYLRDSVKENASETVSELKKLGIRTVMLTGDNEKTARLVAEELGIDAFKAECTPEDKMAYIRETEAHGSRVAMFGDGVNDSLALRAAFAGVAMGGIGSDAAIESAEAVIVHDNLDALPYLFKIARKTQSRITLNLCISLVLNFIAVVLAITGVLNAVWGALFHNCGSVLVVVSAFLLLFWKEK